MPSVITNIYKTILQNVCLKNTVKPDYLEFHGSVKIFEIQRFQDLQ